MSVTTYAFGVAEVRFERVHDVKRHEPVSDRPDDAHPYLSYSLTGTASFMVYDHRPSVVQVYDRMQEEVFPQSQFGLRLLVHLNTAAYVHVRRRQKSGRPDRWFLNLYAARTLPWMRLTYVDETSGYTLWRSNAVFTWSDRGVLAFTEARRGVVIRKALPEGECVRFLGRDDVSFQGVKGFLHD